jgi:hypothetical protein
MAGRRQFGQVLMEDLTWEDLSYFAIGLAFHHSFLYGLDQTSTAGRHLSHRLGIQTQ